MSKPFFIRAAHIDDLIKLKQLLIDTITSVCSADYNASQINAWIASADNLQRWQDILTQQFVVVAEYQGEVVGFATLDKGNYIDLLYTHKDFQGKGVAKSLIHEIEAQAKHLHQTTLTADVSKTAKPFFEKMGFSLVKENMNTIKGVDVVNYKMIKTLSLIL